MLLLRNECAQRKDSDYLTGGSSGSRNVLHIEPVLLRAPVARHCPGSKLQFGSRLEWEDCFVSHISSLEAEMAKLIVADAYAKR